MRKAGGRSRASDPSSEYASWDRQAATARALAHVGTSKAVDRSTRGVWNFAFGSNMLPEKVAERRMEPLCVVRGRLPGWRLLFNHRGGYGNIESTDVISEQQLDLTHLEPQSELEPQPEPEEDTDSRSTCTSSGCNYLAHKTQEHGYCCKACMRGKGTHGAACEQVEATSQPLGALPQDEVHGALLLLTHEEFGRLASEEYGYNTIELAVHVYEEDLAACCTYQKLPVGTKQAGRHPKIGGTIHALAFKSSACAVVEASTIPSTRYINLLREGATTLRIDKRYCDWLEKLESRQTVH